MLSGLLELTPIELKTLDISTLGLLVDVPQMVVCVQNVRTEASKPGLGSATVRRHDVVSVEKGRGISIEN
jgi:hypothetical protein